jgi:hypothetical protein
MEQLACPVKVISFFQFTTLQAATPQPRKNTELKEINNEQAQ